MFGGDRKHLFDPEPMKFVNDVRLLFRISLVHREKQRAPSLSQQAHEFEIRRGQFGTAVDYHDDGSSLIEGDSRLAKNLRWDEIFFFGKNSAGIDDTNAAAAPFRITVKAIARNARFVANNGAARAHDAIEERGLAYIRPAHDGNVGTPAAVVARVLVEL